MWLKGFNLWITEQLAKYLNVILLRNVWYICPNTTTHWNKYLSLLVFRVGFVVELLPLWLLILPLLLQLLHPLDFLLSFLLFILSLLCNLFFPWKINNRKLKKHRHRWTHIVRLFVTVELTSSYFDFGFPLPSMTWVRFPSSTALRFCRGITSAFPYPEKVTAAVPFSRSISSISAS